MSRNALLTLRRRSYQPWSPVAELAVSCRHTTSRTRLPMPAAWNRDEAGVRVIRALVRAHRQRTRCACADWLVLKYGQRVEVLAS
jgi:hypothetical protein